MPLQRQLTASYDFDLKRDFSVIRSQNNPYFGALYDLVL